MLIKSLKKKGFYNTNGVFKFLKELREKNCFLSKDIKFLLFRNFLKMSNIPEFHFTGPNVI